MIYRDIASYYLFAAKLCPRLYGDKDERVNLKFPSDITDGSSLMKMRAEVFRALANQEISPVFDTGHHRNGEHMDLRIY